MFSHKHFINIISIFIIILISAVYFFTFCNTKLNNSTLVFFFIVIFLILFLTALFIIDKTNFKSYKKYITGIVILALAIQAWEIFSANIIYYQSSIWIHNYISKQNPYNLSGDLAMPVFYFILVPFHLAGNLMFSDSLGFLVLVFTIFKFIESDKERTFKVLLILLSPLVFYGLIYSPGKILLSALFVLFIFMSSKVAGREKYNLSDILISVIFGLLISSFFEMSIILIIYFLYLYKNQLGKFFLSILISIITFFITLVPFLNSHNKNGFINNLFSSSVFLNVFPWWGIIILLLLSIYIGWMISDAQEVFFSIGIILFLLFCLELLMCGSSTDIVSNFLMVIPFFILSIKSYQVNKFLGKVLE